MHVQELLEDLDCWTHFLHVHKELLKVSKHFHEYFRYIFVLSYVFLAILAKWRRIVPTIDEIVNIYGKTLVKCTTGRVTSCDYTVFLRVLGKSVHFYRALPYKMRISINCIFIWTHFLHVHKALLKVSKHFHEHFRSVVRIFRYSCTMAENSFSMIVEIVNLYGKTRVKCTTGRVPSYDYTVFLRVLRKRVHFYRVLPYKMRISINCIFIRVLPVKTQHGYQNRPQNEPPNRTRIALNTRFVEVIRV